MGLFNLLPEQLTTELVTKAEGEYRPGPYFLPLSGGWLSAEMGQYWNWWQMGGDVVPSGARSALVEACVSAYSQTVAMCPGDHWRQNSRGGVDRVTNSALYRILRYPNAYQSISDFMLNATRSLYMDGNTYALALRNDRFEINELHLMHPRQSSPVVADNGEVFYRLSGNPVIEKRMNGQHLIVPSRDVLHIRLHTSRNPLIGESPLHAAAMDIAAGSAITNQQLNFYLNQARPSIVLGTDMVLDKDQVAFLRAQWEEQSRGLNTGGTPILTAGLKPVPLSLPAKDAELAEIMKLTEQHIALAFRVPLQILGIGGTPLGSTEALMQSWVQSSLGFCLNHIEEAFGVLFQLDGQPDEYCEFSTKSLLRSAFKDRIEGLVRGVQGGVFAPNEARNEEGLPDVKFGDEPRVQQQLVPLSAAAAIPALPGPGAPPAQPAAAASKDYGGEERGVNEQDVVSAFRASHARTTAA